MNRYEGLFILDTVGAEEGVQAAVDALSSLVKGVGGEVETVQKMDKRQFSRVTDKRVTSGYYTNLIFSVPAGELPGLEAKFQGTEGVHRVLVTHLAEVATEASAAS